MYLLALAGIYLEIRELKDPNHQNYYDFLNHKHLFQEIHFGWHKIQYSKMFKKGKQHYPANKIGSFRSLNHLKNYFP